MLKKIVVSKNKSLDLGSNYIAVQSPKEAIEKLSQSGFKKTLLAGGSTINAAFAKEDLLDEVILNIEPAIVGRGIPIFANEDFNLKIDLVSVDKIENGILSVKYRVLRANRN